MRAIEVRDASQVASARREAVQLARKYGFEDDDSGRVAIIATELTTNLLKHGGGGELLVGAFDDLSGTGIQCLALDKGPGITDLTAAMIDGYSTAQSAGTGLGAVRRGTSFFDIFSSPGMGTAVLARLERGKKRSTSFGRNDYGAVCIPMRGEDVCGDTWCSHDLPNGLVAMVCDGLGHGMLAAEASRAAARIFTSTSEQMPNDALNVMHAALKPTRGAAIALARIDRNAGQIQYAGVGNISGVIVEPDGSSRHMVSHNGIIGHVARQIRSFTYPINDASLVVMASDGLSTNWKLGHYPGLLNRHPQLIAAILYRDFARGRDDVTVMVVKGTVA